MYPWGYMYPRLGTPVLEPYIVGLVRLYCDVLWQANNKTMPACVPTDQRCVNQVTSLLKCGKQVWPSEIFLCRKSISRETTHAQSYNFTQIQSNRIPLLRANAQMLLFLPLRVRTFPKRVFPPKYFNTKWMISCAYLYSPEPLLRHPKPTKLEDKAVRGSVITGWTFSPEKEHSNHFTDPASVRHGTKPLRLICTVLWAYHNVFLLWNIPSIWLLIYTRMGRVANSKSTDPSLESYSHGQIGRYLDQTYPSISGTSSKIFFAASRCSSPDDRPTVRPTPRPTANPTTMKQLATACKRTVLTVDGHQPAAFV